MNPQTRRRQELQCSSRADIHRQTTTTTTSGRTTEQTSSHPISFLTKAQLSSYELDQPPRWSSWNPRKTTEAQRWRYVSLSPHYMRKTTTNGCFFPLHKRKQTSAPGKQQLAHQEKTQKDCKQTQALLLMWQHSTNSLSLSLSHMKLRVQCNNNNTSWKFLQMYESYQMKNTWFCRYSLSLSHTHTASKAESQQSSESFSSQKNELTVSSQQQQHLQANMFPNVGEPNEN